MPHIIFRSKVPLGLRSVTRWKEFQRVTLISSDVATHLYVLVASYLKCGVRLTCQWSIHTLNMHTFRKHSLVHPQSSSLPLFPIAYHISNFRIAISAGDGSVRVWQTHTTNDLEDQLATGFVTSYWQNVQGKILTIAWHPTKENLLAFATAESRVL